MPRALETSASDRRQSGAIPIQRLFLLLFLSLFLPLFPVGTTLAAQTTLAWDPPVNTDGSPFTGVAGYHLYFGTASGTYSQDINVGNVTSHTVSNLAEGGTYYFAVTDYDAAGNESGYSNEVSKTFATTYSVTATAGAGGTISPVGSTTASTATNGTYTITSVTAPVSSSISFSITAKQGYQISNVTVDGVSVGKVTTYTLSNINTSHAITANFTTAAGTAPLKGDVDSDGVVSLADALTALRSVTNNTQLTTDQMSRADVWPPDASGKPLGDGTVNLNDALLILRKAVGLVAW